MAVAFAEADPGAELLDGPAVESAVAEPVRLAALEGEGARVGAAVSRYPPKGS